MTIVSSLSERTATRRDALASFCAAEYPRLVGTLTLYCGDRPIAEELAQEALVRVCQHWSRIRRLENPGGWVHRVAINLANSHFRRRAAEQRATDRLRARGFEGRQNHQSPTAGVEARSMVAELPPRQRAALILRHYVGLSVAETACELDCPEGTVKRLTHMAIQTLRRTAALEEELEDGHAK